MTHEQAQAEAARRQAEDPRSTWTALERQGAWVVARIGVPHERPTGTATKPPPQAPPEDPPGRELRTTLWGTSG